MSDAMLTQRPIENKGQTTSTTNGEQITTLLGKLNALLELGLNCELKNHSNAELHSYLWVISDLLAELKVEILR